MNQNENKSGKYKELLLSIDEENNKCVDCGKENPTRVSVNNGVIICEECAEKHNQLGSMISYVLDINGEFDEYLLNYFTLGGNSKFKKFINEENIDNSLPIEKKYITKAVDFYRKNLKHKVQGENLLEKNYENPNEILEHPDNYFPEFQNYQIKKDVAPGKTKVQQAKSVMGKIGGSLLGFGKKVYSGVKQGATYVGNKATVGAKYVGNKAIEGGKYVANKAQPATNQIKKGAAYVGHQIGGVYSNIKNQIVNKDKGEENKEDEKKKEEGENSEVNNNENNKIDENKAAEKPEDKDNPLTGELTNQPLADINIRTNTNNEGNPESQA